MPSKIFKLIALEEKRQKETLMLIPSENYTYPEVRKAVGSVLMQKYAEGQPFKRYYQGNKYVDEVESYCEKLALEAFNLSPVEWGVNVQPYSGTPANLAVYNALLEPGDKIMSMFLPDGGHLSHGWQYGDKKVTLVSKFWNVDFYHVNSKTKVFDYDQIEKQALAFKPKLIISGGTAYPREINHKRMAEIAHKVGAYYHADIAHEAGLVAAGVNTSPFAFADVVTMTTHKTLRGPRGAMIFSKKSLSDKIDSSVFPGLQGGPHIHTIAGIAIALENVKTPEFKEYAKLTLNNASKMAEEFMKKCYEVVSGGTDKHLVLIDLRNKKTSGWFAAFALERVGLVTNRNTVPNDTGSPFYPSGLRLGTPAISVRKMGDKEVVQIVSWIDEVIGHLGPKSLPEDKEERIKYLAAFKKEIDSDSVLEKIAKEVKSLALRFPIP